MNGAERAQLEPLNIGMRLVDTINLGRDLELVLSTPEVTPLALALAISLGRAEELDERWTRHGIAELLCLGRLAENMVSNDRKVLFLRLPSSSGEEGTSRCNPAAIVTVSAQPPHSYPSRNERTHIKW